MDKSISQKVLQKIKQEKISPKSKWNFFLCRTGVGIILVGCFILGAMSFGIIFSLFSQFEMERIFSRPGGMRMIFSSLPYVWIFLLATFLVLTVIEFVKTRHGYKYRTKNVALVFFLAVIFSGGVFHALGVSQKTENYLENYFPAYGQIIKTPKDVWLQPQRGLLSGTIVADDEKNCHCLKLRDWEEKIWEVEYSKALIRARVRKNEGEMIKILGSDLGEHKFEAEEIRPWMGRGKGNMNN